jgi:uridine kinase
MVTIRVEGGPEARYPVRTRPLDILPAPRGANGLPYIGALVNNDVVSLTYPIEVDCDLRLLTAADPEGWLIYQRSVSFLLAKTVRELFPAASFSVDHAVGDGLCCSFEEPGPDGRPAGIRADQLGRIEARMRELIARDVLIERRKLAFTEAMQRLTEAGQTDKVNLLRFRNPPRVVIHLCEGFYDLAQGPLAASTGALGCFALVHHPPHFVLQLGRCEAGMPIPPFRDQPHLFQIFQEHKAWGRILGVSTVGRLNELIAAGQVSEFIKIAEALHEKKIARIADDILARSDTVRVALVGGPSSAGKTTFAKRLAIQLRVNGLIAHTLSLDDYFFELARTLRDAAGNPDFEHLEALDLELFHRHMSELLAGREIEPPHFDFETKQRTFPGERLRLDPGHLLLIEGLHGLNPQLTRALPPASQFRIYVSALTQLSLDAHNRISTTDNRLIRRIVRDHRYRRHSALTTLRMWPSVRRGEERWVFPFQGEAHATFNSALDYELAVLKPMVEPLLMQVKPSEREYADARRLTGFLLNFLGIPDREVPAVSILREYIGRSGFEY